MSTDPTKAARAARCARLGAVVLLLVSATGCGPVGAVVSNVLRSGPPAVVDAHTVYRQRPGCATLAARTTSHGYTILTPQEGGPYEISGIFEGPAREGESIFHYVPPALGASWEDALETAVDVPVEVSAVDVELPDVRLYLDRFCGELPPGVDEAGDAVPRVPIQRRGL